MKLKGFKRRLAAAGVDVSFIKRCDITCQESGGSKRMVVVIDSFAVDRDGRRFRIHDGAAKNGRPVATERRVMDLEAFLAAVNA